MKKSSLYSREFSVQSKEYSGSLVSLHSSDILRTWESPKHNIINTVTMAADKCWRYYVVIACFFNIMISDGLAMCSGLFLTDLMDKYKIPIADMSIIYGVFMSCFYFSCLFVCAIANSFGFRTITIIGALTYSLGIVLTGMYSEYFIVLLSFGVMGGIGFGFIFWSSITIVGLYFDNWRGLATALSVAGSSLGCPLWLYMYLEMQKKFNWETTFSIIGIVVSSCAVFALFYRNPKTVPIHVEFIYVENYRAPSTILIRGLNDSNSSENIVDKKEMSCCFKTFPNNKFLIINNAIIIDDPRVKLPEVKHSKCQKCYRCFFCCCFCSHNDKRAPFRPMYRDDALFYGSLVILPEYIRCRDDPAENYHYFVSRTATLPDLHELGDISCKYLFCCCNKKEIDKNKKKNTKTSISPADHSTEIRKRRCITSCCTEACRRTFATMLNCHLLKSPSFIILSISVTLTYVALHLPLAFIIEKSIKRGVEKNTAVYILATIGACDVIGRILCPITKFIPKMKATIVCSILLCLSGIFIITIEFYFVSWLRFVNAVIFGTTITALHPLRSIIIVELIGLPNLTNAYGILLIFQGFATMCGMAVGGHLIERTGDFKVTFIVCGIILIVASVFLMFVVPLAQWEKNRQEMIDSNQSQESNISEYPSIYLTGSSNKWW